MIMNYIAMLYAAKDIIREQSKGEWDENTISKDAADLVRDLIDLSHRHGSPADFYDISKDFVERQSEGEWSEAEVEEDAKAIGDFMYNFCATMTATLKG